MAANHSEGHTESHSVATPLGPTTSHGGSAGQSQGGTLSESESWSQANTHSQSTTRSQSQTASQGGSVADGVSRSESQGRTAVTTVSEATTRSESRGESWGETHSYAHTSSRADTVSRSESQGVAESQSANMSVGRALTASRGLGFTGGLIPTVSASKSYQWQDDRAILITRYLRQQQALLDRATLEGAFLTDVYLLTRTDTGHEAGRALSRQAFHGTEDVVTGVRAVKLPPGEQAYICRHGRNFTPSTREEPVGRSLSAYRDSTLLTMMQIAAYVSPGLFEEGAATTTQERMPAFAFYPDMPGEVELAHQYSPETGRLTRAPVRIDRERMMHTVFVGDSGYGKTIAAERMALETTHHWGTRTLVFDYGQGWRKMLNAPELDGRVELRQLHPNAVRPLRWNPLQIGRRVNPGLQLRRTCELFANAGGMGPKQVGLMRGALEGVYRNAGALTDDAKVWGDKRWGVVRQGEEDVINAAVAALQGGPSRSASRRLRGGASRLLRGGTSRSLRGGTSRLLRGEPLAALTPMERQALATHRSVAVDIQDWYEALEKERKKVKADGTRLSLEGVLLRLSTFSGGSLARIYGKAAPGDPTMEIEELGLMGAAPASPQGAAPVAPLGTPRDRWGMAVLEGGSEMDEYAKITLLSLILWRIYADAVVRRRQQERGPRIQIVLEEANKIIGGIGGGDQERGATGMAAHFFEELFRDSRKYDIWLYAIFQTISAVSPAIFSCCPNGFIGQSKNARDRDAIMAWLAKSEKGFVDEDYKRYLSRIPAETLIGRFGYSRDPRLGEPFVCRAIMVEAEEPTDWEILDYYRDREYEW